MLFEVWHHVGIWNMYIYIFKPNTCHCVRVIVNYSWLCNVSYVVNKVFLALNIFFASGSMLKAFNGNPQLPWKKTHGLAPGSKI